MAFVGGRPLVPQEVAGIAVKAVPWSFFVGALGFAINSLTGNSNLVTKIYFPREVLPLAADAGAGVRLGDRPERAARRVPAPRRALRRSGVLGARSCSRCLVAFTAGIGAARLAAPTCSSAM